MHVYLRHVEKSGFDLGLVFKRIHGIQRRAIAQGGPELFLRQTSTQSTSRLSALVFGPKELQDALEEDGMRHEAHEALLFLHQDPLHQAGGDR